MQPLEQEDPDSLGDYRVVGRLGEGGMGRVFLGRSPSGRSVAIKVVHASLVHEPEFGTGSDARWRCRVWSGELSPPP